MRRLYRAVAACLALIALFLLLTYVIARGLAPGFHRKIVGPAPPASMPVLVVDRGREGQPVDARITLYCDLGTLPPPKYVRSFEARSSEEATVNGLIGAGSRRSPDSGSGDSLRLPGFVRRESRPDGDVMRVEDTSDSDRVRVGWYRAKGTSIEAVAYQRYFGPGLVLMSAAISAATTAGLAVLFVTVLLVRSIRKRRLNPQ